MWIATILFILVTIFIVFFTIYANSNIKDSLIGGRDLMPTRRQPINVYSSQDIRDLLPNSCKLPYIFQSNIDVDDYYGSGYRPECSSNDEIFQLTINGTLSLQLSIQKVIALQNFSCDYYSIKPEISSDLFMDYLGNSKEIKMYTPITVSDINLAVVCKRYDNIIYMKPFLNIASIYKNSPPIHDPHSIAIILLPSMNYKLFSKILLQSKEFLVSKRFHFFKMVYKENPNSMKDTINQLALDKPWNVFDLAKLYKFQTFFSGPEKVRTIIDNYNITMDFDSTTYKKFLERFFMKSKSVEKCLNDGRKYAEDDIQIFEYSTIHSKYSNFFSTVFIDDYGLRKRIIDDNLYSMFEQLNTLEVFKNTTIIVTSYNSTNNELEKEDDRNPFFAIRLSDNYKKKYPDRDRFIELNSNRKVRGKIEKIILKYFRLMSTLHINSLISSLISGKTENDKVPSPLLSPFSNLNSCEDLHIQNEMCHCMKPPKPNSFNSTLFNNLIDLTRKSFHDEMSKYQCIKSIEIENDYKLYQYLNRVKGDIRVIEYFANVIVSNGEIQNKMKIVKTFKFEETLVSFHGYAIARILLPNGNNIEINRICTKLPFEH